MANTIFKKQVSPILTYGCPLWIMPKTNNSLDISMRLDRYANVQVKQLLEHLLDKPVNITKSIIHRSLNTVSVTLGNWEDKQYVLKLIQNKPFAGKIASPGNENSDLLHEIDKVHAKMSKFALGVSKYTSNTAVFRELGQIPVSIQAKVLAVMPYFYRLNNVINKDNNVLLNAAYSCMTDFSHPWISSMTHFFCSKWIV